MSEQAGAARPPYPREPMQAGGTQEPGGDRDLPPYKDRQTTGKSGEQLEQERGGPGSSQAGPRDVSQAEREGMTDTDTSPSGPMGVGESTTTSGQDIMRGTSEEARRTDRLDGGIADTERNVDEESPVMRTGDQGG
ncbi:MAG: hypothetical protein M3460_22695 [Actinomycetota bacterium]|nr:hypothetical protein [Actinomycetota bacterium]